MTRLKQLTEGALVGAFFVLILLGPGLFQEIIR